MLKAILETVEVAAIGAILWLTTYFYRRNKRRTEALRKELLATEKREMQTLLGFILHRCQQCPNTGTKDGKCVLLDDIEKVRKSLQPLSEQVAPPSCQEHSTDTDA